MMLSRISGGFGLHRLGVTGGIVASLLALPCGWLLHWAGGFPLVAGATVALIFLIHTAARQSMNVVVDKFLGQLVALWALSGGLWFAGVAPHVFPWPGVVGAFVFYNLLRFLPPIRKLGLRHPLYDDLAAGALAAVITLVSAAISHGWLT
jgi:phosphatidylglycerophosphatase A